MLTAATRSAARSAQPKLSTDEGVVQQVRRELEHEGVEHEDEHEAEREHERQAQRREQGREHRVERGDHGGHGERAAVPVDVDTGQDHRRHPERQGRQRPGQQQAERLEPRALGLPGDGLPVRGGRRAHRQSLPFEARFASFFAARWVFWSATLTLASP